MGTAASPTYHGPVVALGVLLVLCAIAAALLGGPVRRVTVEHALLGHLGAPRHAEAVSAVAATVVRAAERQGRLAHFERGLRRRAFEGTVLSIEPGPSGWCRWRFANGDVWDVRHRRGPRSAVARLVVAGSGGGDGAALAVRAYVPGRLEMALAVVDARPADDRPVAEVRSGSPSRAVDTPGRSDRSRR